MNELLSFMISALVRSFAVAGYSFFGLIVATQDWKVCLTASGIAGGSYFFTELIRYFKIHPEEVVTKINKKARFNFLIFP